LVRGEKSPALGDATVDGGEIGIDELGWNVLLCGLTGFERSGFGSRGGPFELGDSGGEGVDEDAREV
jgi:hypothetical protein